MKKAFLILTAAVAGYAIYQIIRRNESRKIREHAASEGFETATDILYPNKQRSFSNYRVGPVIPS